MGKINEILKSGIAPGAVCGERPFDPQSVFHKAPKGLRELESQPRYKGGPNYSARDIAKHFGMPLDFIKKTWSKPVPKGIACFLFALLLSVIPAKAGYITAGETLSDGQTVHASDLMNLVQNATIGSGFIYSQPIDNSPLQSDYIIEYSPTLGGLYKATLLNAFLNNPQSITLLPSGTPIYTNNDLFSFYSVGGTNLESISISNLIAFFSIYANPSLFQFAYTNVGTGTNTYFLPNWIGTFSGFNTNLPESIWWGTNSIPYQRSLYGLEASIAPDFGTNLFQPWLLLYNWFPWQIEGTNTVFPYTNSFGFTTNFPILSAYQPNIAATTNLPTLNAGDALPILSLNQAGKNTTVSLNALWGYFTNLNTFPSYTTARIQFSGYPETITISNNAQSAYGLLNITTNTLPTAYGPPYAVSVITNATQIQVALFQTNTVFYLVPTATNSMWVHVYSNYVSATQSPSTSFLPVLNAGTGTANQFIYLTNYTSFNSDVTAYDGIQATYQVWFRGAAANSSYYVSGNCADSPGLGWPWVFMLWNSGSQYTTSEFTVETVEQNFATTAYRSGLIQIIVNPQ